MDEDFNPRKEGKLHWHEEIVRPVKVNPEKIVCKNPLNDLYMDKQDRKHRGRDVDLPLRTIQIHFTELAPGETTRMHKHHNEAAVYIVKGKGYSMVQGKKYDWEAGDFIYIPAFNWHSHTNLTEDTAIYMGITNKRLLDLLGLDRKVESGVHVPEEEVAKEIASQDFSPYSYFQIDPGIGVKFGPPKK